jgi:hypothetical protein
MRITRLVVALAFAAGCGGGSTGEGAVDGGANPDAAAGWATLISADWTLPEGPSEDYLCQLVTAQRDMYISAFDAVAPSGTHHTVLSLTSSTREDGLYPCSGFDIGDAMLFGGGVGTNALYMPDGVAMRISAGQKLLLNLHLFNTNDPPISGNSGILFQEIPEADVDSFAEALLVGPLSLTIDEGEVEQGGRCTLNASTTVFAVAPHMHQLGIHMTVLAETSTGTVPIMDDDYDFDSQTSRLLDPLVSLEAGDVIRVTCRYFNDTGGQVGFGESTTTEMCFAGITVYPPLNIGTNCFD